MSRLQLFGRHRDAANAADTAAVAGSIGNVNSVAGSLSLIAQAVANLVNINSVAANESNINSAVANESNINAAVANEANIQLIIDNLAVISEAENLLALYQLFSSRADLLSYLNGQQNTLSDGDLVSYQGVIFEYLLGSTKITSLPNLIPYGKPTASHFGAIADGDFNGSGTDNQIALSDALFYDNPVDLEGGTYLSSGLLTPYEGGGNIGLYNGNIDFSNAPAGALIRVTAPTVTDVQVISTNLSYKSSVVDLPDSSAYAVGDMIRLKSDADFDSFGAKNSEYAEIESILSPTSIAVKGIIYGEYATLDNATVSKFSKGTVPYFSDLKIKGGGNNGTDHEGLLLRRCFGGQTKNLTFYDVQTRALSIRDCVYHTNDNLVAHKSDREGLGYALEAVGSQWCSFGDLVGYECRHVFTGGYGESVSRFCNVGDVLGSNCRDAVFDLHGGSTDFTIGNVTGTMKPGNGSDDGVVIQGSRITIGNINISGVVSSGVLMQNFGSSDTDRDLFYKTGFISVGGASINNALIIQNLDSLNNSSIDLIHIDGISAKSNSGISVNPVSGNIKKLVINGGRSVTIDGNGLDLLSTAAYTIGEVCLSSLELETLTANGGFYALYCRGGAHWAATGNLGIEDVKLSGCNFKGGPSYSIRAVDAKVRAVMQTSSGYAIAEALNQGAGSVTFIT